MPSRGEWKGRRGQKGFTLLEVIIAICLVALMAKLLFPAMSSTARRFADSSQMERERIIADSQVEKMIALKNPASLASDGKSGEYTWHVVPENNGAPAGSLRTMSVTVTKDGDETTAVRIKIEVPASVR